MFMFYVAKKMVYGTQGLPMIYGSASKSIMPTSQVGQKAEDHLSLSIVKYAKITQTLGREKNILNQAWASAI